MDERSVREVQSAATFPLPFRVLFLLSSGILAWATSLHGLHLHAVDGTSILRLDRPALPTTKSSTSSLSYRPVYRLFSHCAAWCLSIWLIYRYSTLHHVEHVDVFKYLPAVGALGLVIGLVLPYDVLELRQREKFLSCVFFSFPNIPFYQPGIRSAVYRCITPQKFGVSFFDVVLADIFTSYAKVFGDLWLSLWMLLPGGSLLVLPPQDGWSRWVLPTLMRFFPSLPFPPRF